MLRCFRGGLRFVIFPLHVDQGDAKLSRNLDQDADPDEDVEDREDLQPRVGDHEVWVGDRRRPTTMSVTAEPRMAAKFSSRSAWRSARSKRRNIMRAERVVLSLETRSLTVPALRERK
jgi:hypothetical protein